MMAIAMLNSSWIDSIAYKRVNPDLRLLAIFLKSESVKDEPVALLYGSRVPSYLPGLLSAGILKKLESGGNVRSIGRAYNKLLKGRLQELGLSYQRVEGREKVAELRRMMQ